MGTNNEKILNEVLDEETKKKLSEDWRMILDAYDQYVYEDDYDIATICETANHIIYDRYRAVLNNPNDQMRISYKMTAMIFVTTFFAIRDFLCNKRETKRQYVVNIGGRLAVGYTNQESEEDEKMGNFMIYIKHMNHHSPKNDSTEFEARKTTREYITEWNQENMIEQPTDTAAIATEAMKRLKTIGINIANAEIIFPFFVTIYDVLIDYMFLRRAELNTDEFEINFCSCFFISAMEQDEGNDRIVIRPCIEQKLSLKSDAIATSKFDADEE